MNKWEIERYGYHIDVVYDRDFMPFRMPNTIEYATVYLVHPNGKSEYVGSTSGAYSADTDWLEEEAVRIAEQYIAKGGAR